MTNQRADLESLLTQLAETRGVRLTARPGRVIVDHRDGVKTLELDWTEAKHTAALAAITPDAAVSGGVSVRKVGDAIVLTRGPDSNRRIDDIARDGGISSLAARFLDAAVSSGRNVIVAGPWLAAVDVVWALTAGAARPAAIDSSDLPLPGGWLRARDVWELSAYGADRTGVWSRDVYELGHLMTSTSGLVGWVDARRLERALMRYEAAIDSASPQAQSPLQVLAGIDLIVIVRSSGPGIAPRVHEVAEITMSQDGYRPQLLFSTGFPPSPTAMIPLAAPSFLDELALGGHGVLADELRAAAPRRSAPMTSREPEPASEPYEEVAPEPLHQAPPRFTRDGQHRHDPLGIRDALRVQPSSVTQGEPVPRAVVEKLRHAPPPGWELDQAGGEAWTEAAAMASNAEDAAMAAQFGLAPPPRPVGYKGETVSFTELLKRAKENEQLGNGDQEQLPTPPRDDT